MSLKSCGIAIAEELPSNCDCGLKKKLCMPTSAEYRLSVLLAHRSSECTPSYQSTGISNLLQPAQAEVVLGQLSTHLASWVSTEYTGLYTATVRGQSGETP
jgi:hypothetical protein